MTSVREEAPFTGVPGALQQRKFMSLIDTKQHPLLMAQHVGGEDEDEEAVVGVDESDGMGSEDIEPECYHEIHAIPLLDPVLDKQARRMGRGKGGSWGSTGQRRKGMDGSVSLAWEGKEQGERDSQEAWLRVSFLNNPGSCCEVQSPSLLRVHTCSIGACLSQQRQCTQTTSNSFEKLKTLQLRCAQLV